AATRQSVDVAELLDILAQRLRLVARDRNLHLELELPGQLLALGDATQLEHVFINLLDNAAKYAPDGATITVRAAYAPEPSVAVSVHNTGSYIAPDDLPHIFERFYRADRSRSREAGGSGLGLAIAREIVERHGGTIEARSDAASGTTFSVTLPAAPQPAGAARATAAPRPRGAPASPPAVVARDQHSPVA
ncbi:MAG TPA: sensor histidine kinase, partial [Chloroflexota bacterium]|nr:sensor histidine kinase [Chloroflexota bacterium]